MSKPKSIPDRPLELRAFAAAIRHDPELRALMHRDTIGRWVKGENIPLPIRLLAMRPELLSALQADLDRFAADKDSACAAA